MSSGKYMIKFCKNCGIDTEQYKHNGCKPCALKRHANWAKANRDKVNAVSRAWNAQNAEKKRATNAEYRNKKQTEINKKRQAKRLENPELERIKAAKRRAHKKQSGGVLSTGIIDKLLQMQNGLCACCSNPLNGLYHLDHIVPLSLGGKNSDDNVQLLLPKCNLQKYNAPPEEFFKRREKERLQCLI
jgi:5-methylcytosine-specific restriction endonuclease McrA